MEAGRNAVRPLDPEPPVPDDFILLSDLSTPFNSQSKIPLNPGLSVIEVVVLPGRVQRGVADDQMGHLTAQEGLCAQVVVE